MNDPFPTNYSLDTLVKRYKILWKGAMKLWGILKEFEGRKRVVRIVGYQLLDVS